MGTYTPSLKFYKPDASEFVDVETQLNSNWSLADTAVKRLLEYEYCASQNPDVSYGPDRARFYKAYSNSVVMRRNQVPDWYQDPAARVSPWVQVPFSIIGAGYDPYPEAPLAYRIIKNVGGTTAEVEWSGAFWGDNSPMDLNLNVTIISPGDLPSTIYPTVAKYFTIWGGNTTTNFSVARAFFGNTGGVDFKRYGVDPGANTIENRIDFTGIRYNIEVPA